MAYGAKMAASHVATMIGRTIAHYRILSQLGSGGMGVVYLARDHRLRRDVALKVLPAGTLADESARNALIQEAQTASALNHPNICTIYEIGEADHQTYIAMERVEGKSLFEMIGPNGMPTETVMQYAIAIADALAEAHGHGILHRDVKASNVMVTPRGQIKILDFGLAKQLAAWPDAQTLSEDMETEPGKLLGTPEYFPPEMLRGERVDARGDIWSFGVLLYQMLSGHMPFAGRTSFQLSSEILKESPAPLPAEIPADLREIVDRCLAKQPAERYRDAGEVRTALEAVRARTTQRAILANLPKASRWRSWALPVVTAGILVIGALVLSKNGRFAKFFAAAPAQRISSLAVLPLANLSGDPSQEYFADGMTDALITELSKVRALKVISRTSVMQYKKAQKPLPEIAKELGVDAVIEGSVTREGNEVRIAVDLIDGRTDKHLWSQEYRREMEGVLELESDVARQVVRKVQVELTPQEQANLTRTSRVDPQAQEAYLKGRYLWDKQSPSSVRAAIGYFEHALEIDPNYAPAYAGLAGCYIALSWIGVDPLPAGEAYPKAKDMAQKALALDGTLDEAHVILGLVNWRSEWDWDAAESEFRQALELNPSSADAHQWYGLYLAAMKRKQESDEQFARAKELDPLSLLVSVNTGWAAYFARDYKRDIDKESATLQFWPDAGVAHYHLGLAYEQVGRPADAIAEFEKAIAISGRMPYLLSALGHAYAQAGRTREAREILRELTLKTSVPPSLVASVWAGLGEKGKALDWLEKARAARDPYLVFLQVNPVWDPLRSQPAFQRLLAEVGFNRA